MNLNWKYVSRLPTQTNKQHCRSFIVVLLYRYNIDCLGFSRHTPEGTFDLWHWTWDIGHSWTFQDIFTSGSFKSTYLYPLRLKMQCRHEQSRGFFIWKIPKTNPSRLSYGISPWRTEESSFAWFFCSCRKSSRNKGFRPEELQLRMLQEQQHLLLYG